MYHILPKMLGTFLFFSLALVICIEDIMWQWINTNFIFESLRFQRHRIQESIRRVDLVLRTLRAAQQIIRRVYSAPMRYDKVKEFVEALFS